MKALKVERRVFADFEFNRTVERMVNLVSCSTFDPQTNTSKNFWLHNSPREQKRLKDYLLTFQTVVSYAAIAEARSFLALGLNPLDFNWVDLFIEYKMISNHNDHINWGKQLVSGRVKRVFKPRPKWERVEGEEVTGFKPTFSLAEATFKLTGEIRDTKEKNEARDLIISDPKEFTTLEKRRILDYGQEDVVFLPAIEKEIIKEMKRLVRGLNLKEYDRERKARGRYAAHTALMESNGYPIDYDKTRNFASQVGIILYDLQMEINDLFPDILPFKYDKRQKRFTWNQKRTREWIKSCHDISTWMKTDTGNLSLSLEAFEKFYQFKHDYPQDNFGAQMLRYLKMKQSLYGFSAANESKSKKSLWTSVGSDKRVRPYMNIFGAQSSRSQPAATGFMFLKPAWMRALVMPPKGYYMAGIDYGSQEFFLAALKSGDKAMIQAYLSGDPYLAFGILSKQIPKNGTKETHGIQRDLCKSTVLGISYLMSKYGLAIKLTNDTKRVWTEEEAQEQIDLFYNTFPWLKADQDQCLVDYQNNGYLKLPCVAKGTKVWTDSGVKNIEDVLTTDKIWDGCEWVSNGGILPKGVKDVIHLKEMNLNVTPDHWILQGGTWRTAVEVRWAEENGTPLQKSPKFLEDGRLLVQSHDTKADVVSFVAAYAALKSRLESRVLELDMLEPVLTALNLYVPKDLNAPDTAMFLMTNIWCGNGKLASLMPKNVVEILEASNIGITAVAGFDSISNPLEGSWNTLLVSMGFRVGMGRWTELITTDITKLETYELLAKERTTKTDVFDLLNCGPRFRFQTEKGISHNCGWYMFGDNPNFRSVTNVPIQGRGASIMRKAVDLAYNKGVSPMSFTLHDALYIEAKVGEESKILKLRDAMKEAFVFYAPDEFKDVAARIRLDPKAWSRNYKPNTEIKINGWKIPTTDLHIDKRALVDYQRFSPYFEPNEGSIL